MNIQKKNKQNKLAGSVVSKKQVEGNPTLKKNTTNNPNVGSRESSSANRTGQSSNYSANSMVIQKPKQKVNRVTVGLSTARVPHVSKNVPVKTVETQTTPI